MDYQELFNYMANNHDVNLLESEMQEVISIVKGMLNNDEAPIETPNVNNNEAQKKDCNSCEYRWLPINDCTRCDYLNNYKYWKQSD